MCFRPIRFDSLRFFLGGDPPVCRKCFEELTPQWIRWTTEGTHCLALYEYGGKIKSTLYQFKGCGDYELFPVFFYFASPFIRLRYHGYCVVPAPSSKSHNDERGFNQVIAMCEALNMKIVNPLSKFEESKQSSLSAAERAKVGRIIGWNKGLNIKGEKILLVDDVYTTGSTIRACIKLLRQHGAQKVEVLVMSKTPARRA